MLMHLEGLSMGSQRPISRGGFDGHKRRLTSDLQYNGSVCAWTCLTPRAFWLDRRYPIANRWRDQSERYARQSLAHQPVFEVVIIAMPLRVRVGTLRIENCSTRGQCHTHSEPETDLPCSETFRHRIVTMLDRPVMALWRGTDAACYAA